MNERKLVTAGGALVLLLASSGCATLVGAGIGRASSRPERDVAVSQVRELRPGVRVTVTLRNDSVTTGEYLAYSSGSGDVQQEGAARPVSSALTGPPSPAVGASILIRNNAGEHLFYLDQVRTVRLSRGNYAAKGAAIGLLVDVGMGILYLLVRDIEMFDPNGTIFE